MNNLHLFILQYVNIMYKLNPSSLFVKFSSCVRAFFTKLTIISGMSSADNVYKQQLYLQYNAMIFCCTLQIRVLTENTHKTQKTAIQKTGTQRESLGKV